MTTSIQRILVPTDFCAPAKRAREIAIAIAGKFGADVTLLHAYHLPALPYGDGFVGQMNEIARSAHDSMEDELAEAKREYAKVDALVRAASPADAIVSAARELSADLIVMGTQGERGVSHFFLGSVAQNVVRLAARPVLTVPAKDAGFA